MFSVAVALNVRDNAAITQNRQNCIIFKEIPLNLLLIIVIFENMSVRRLPVTIKTLSVSYNR